MISYGFSFGIAGGMVVEEARGVKQAINEKLIVLAGAAVIKGMGGDACAVAEFSL